MPLTETRSRTRSFRPGGRLALVALLALSLACGRQQADDQLKIISPHPETMLYEYEAAFAPWYREQTGRTVRMIYLDQGGTSRMLRYLYNEFARSPEGTDIDVVWGGGIESYIEMVGKGILQPWRLPGPILDRVPKDYFGIPLYDGEFRWYGTALTGFGIVYNRRVLELQDLPTPQTWLDLTNPEFQSWVGSADPRQSGSNHVVFEIILQAHGWEKGWEIVTAMAANIKVFSRLASDVPKDAALGEIACGLCIDSYAYAQMAFTGRDVLGYVMPEGLTVVNPEGIGILKGAPNREVARLFVDFVMSETGQRLLMAPVGKYGGPEQFRIARMSIQPKLYEEMGERSVVPVNPFRRQSALTLDSKKASLRWKLLNDLFAALLIDNHGLLQEAWETMAACPPKRREVLRAQLAAMPVTEEEAMALVRDVWTNPDERVRVVEQNRIIAQWSRFAREKYETVLAEARKCLATADPGL